MVFRFFYNGFIQLFFAGIHIASQFNEKAKMWLTGRKNWKNKLTLHLKANPPKPYQPIIWLHASSLGEFEQGKPLLEALGKHDNNPYIVVSFFSPSGYEVSKQYKGANYICYLPLDTPSNAKYFINTLKPHLVLWVKYEYWWHYLYTLHKQAIPVLLISAIFQQRQAFFKWYGTLHKKMLGFFSHVFVQTAESAKLIAPYLPQQKLTVAGDTRFDRVLSILKADDLPIYATTLLNMHQTIVVAGSTWPEDEVLIAKIAEKTPHVFWVIAPHHVDASSLEKTGQLFKNPNKLSVVDKLKPTLNGNVLIIDSVGMLSRIYRHATICYIGGGFSSTGIHNALEAAVFSKPLLFGPRFQEYAEAVGLIAAKGAYSVSTYADLEIIFEKLLNDTHFRQQTGAKAGDYVQTHAGATKLIMDFIYKNRLLTKL